MMSPADKEQAYEYLRSCALQAHEAIKALREDNYGAARDLIDDSTRDLELARNTIPESES